MSRGRAGRGALIILALLLASSGALRIGSGVGAAMALSPDAEITPEGTSALNCPAPPLALAEALSLREARVLVQEAALADRMAALTLAESAASTRLAEMEAAEEELKATLALAEGAAEGDLARLTAVYEAMKPKDAAVLFETMAPEFAAGFLGRMQPSTAGAILSGMQAEAAYGISVILAGRNANAPTE